MQQTIKVEDLRLGMYVILSTSWLKHGFLRNQFKLTSEGQLRELRRQGLTEVVVDLDKSDLADEARMAPRLLSELAYISHNDAPHAPPVDPRDQPPPTRWHPENLVSPELFEAIHDKQMAPEKKSRVVYHHSREMMERLLEAPTAENIKTGKEAIRSLSDLVLSDGDTASAMLRITAHDFYTYTHSVNVGVTSLMLAKQLFGHSDGHDMHELAAGFFLHDLGKIKVDPAIINKPARLTETEMRRMRIHPYQGYKILKEAEVMSEECRIVVLEHHELFDGSGYPRRLGGDQLHIYGRICCIADVFDALTAERSYKKAMAPFDALTLMRDKMPHHFEKNLFARFVTLFRA
ncbi:MAG: HD-GYP domain-containing protein [Gammaproteobacteria bacterium]|nr:HD-GYP domain-containing protein [Gammaproteobacteria bacterium]